MGGTTIFGRFVDIFGYLVEYKTVYFRYFVDVKLVYPICKYYKIFFLFFSLMPLMMGIFYALLVFLDSSNVNSKKYCRLKMTI